MRIGWTGAIALLVAQLLTSASPAFAQSYSFDARRIALGGAAGTPNIASKLVERERRYKSILIPVGLVKLLSNVRVFYPNREDFDFTRAVEYVNSPLHFVFGRSDDLTARSLFRHIVQARLEPDLNAYSGFQLPVLTDAEGLVSLTWGKTFTLREDERSFQRIYVGAGPYLAAQAYFDLDAQLEQILSGSGDRYVPSASMGMGGGETDQLALDITGAYRARFPLFAQAGDTTTRNGLYVAANYHQLIGLRFDQIDARLRLDTDPDGRVIVSPPERPLTLDWLTTSKGVGLAMDVGVSWVVGHWDIGYGITGIANRITWRDFTHRDLSLLTLFNGAEFVYVKAPRPQLEKRIELPVTYTGDISYHRDSWSVYAEASEGLAGTNYRLGLEVRVRAVELRGAGRYSNGSYFPSVGAGINLTRTFGVDFALYGAQSFLEAKPHVGLAISLRIDHR